MVNELDETRCLVTQDSLSDGGGSDLDLILANLLLGCARSASGRGSLSSFARVSVDESLRGLDVAGVLLDVWSSSLGGRHGDGVDRGLLTCG